MVYFDPWKSLGYQSYTWGVRSCSGKSHLRSFFMHSVCFAYNMVRNANYQGLSCDCKPFKERRQRTMKNTQRRSARHRKYQTDKLL